MRGTRRRLLDLAGTFFLGSLLARVVFLIMGLRTYATRPEIPLRLLEIAVLLLAALFTYFFSYRFGFLAMTAASLLSLYTPLRELIAGSHITIGYVNQDLDGWGYIFTVVLIAGLLLLAVLSIIINPRFPREKRTRQLIRGFSVTVMLIFASRMIYHVVLLIVTLISETYPGEFTTKYFYVLAATDFALIVTGLACFMTAAIRPAEHRRKPEEQEA